MTPEMVDNDPSPAEVTPFGVSAQEGGDAPIAAQILRLDIEAARVDGTAPLDDQVRLDVQQPSSAAFQWVTRRASDAEGINGYAHLDLRDPELAVAHLVVAPDERRAGTGSLLLDTLQQRSTGAGPRQLRVWAHGNTSAAQAFAAARSLTPVRELLQLRLPADAPLAEASYPAGVTVRTFSPGDERAWVDANAEAFATHPEQGRLGVDDFLQRSRQQWFDPAGLFLAERDGELLGFHWTKLHPVEPDNPKDARPVGEIYVLGVRPGAQGSGLGRALSLTGLQHLRDTGAGDIILYVEGDNAPALAVYQRVGFERWAADVLYAWTEPSA